MVFWKLANRGKASPLAQYAQNTKTQHVPVNQSYCWIVTNIYCLNGSSCWVQRCLTGPCGGLWIFLLKKELPGLKGEPPSSTEMNASFFHWFPSKKNPWRMIPSGINAHTCPSRFVQCLFPTLSLIRGKWLFSRPRHTDEEFKSEKIVLCHYISHALVKGCQNNKQHYSSALDSGIFHQGKTLKVSF